MTLTKLQFEDTPELIERKKELYKIAQLEIYQRELTKRHVIRKLGKALKEIGVTPERIASTIATELIHPDFFPEGSKSETKDSKGQRQDISGRPNPEAGKSMVHPDYARRNLPEFMKNYSQWRGKDNLDDQMKKKMDAGRTTKGKKINYVRTKKANVVDYDYEIKKKMEELKETEEDKKKDSGSIQETLKEESGQQIDSTLTKEPSSNTSQIKPRKRIPKEEQKQKQEEEPAAAEATEDEEIAKIVIDNKLFPSLQVDQTAEIERLKNINIEAQSNLVKLTEMYDQLLAAYKAVTTPFKERKWVSITIDSKDYIVGVSYKCDPTTRRISNKEFKDETRMLLPHEYKTDYSTWKNFTNGRMSIDLIVESPESASTGST